MSFVRRRIELAIKLAQNTQTNQPNTFVESGTDTVSLTGLRTSVRIQNSGAAAGSKAMVTVFGLNQSLMNQLSTLGMVISIVPKNTITITAGDEGGQMTTVFVGTILDAYADYGSAPNVPFIFECRSGAVEQAIPYPASSYTGSTDVSVILSAIAKRVGWGFENNGVNVKLSNPYYSGSAMDQVRRVAEAARINASLINKVLCIWPRFGARAAGGIPLISPATGMIGYPSFTQQGILVKTLFDPRINFGGQVKVESSIFTAQSLARIQNVESTWNVSKLDLMLDQEMPRGEWTSIIYGYNPRYPKPLPPQAGAR